MKNVIPHNSQYYNQQYNPHTLVPSHPEIFARWARESTRVRANASCKIDITYGATAGERLDLFAGEKNGPLLVFIHGGGWRSLDKSDYSFVAEHYARAGIHVALPNYTLAPAASLREIVRQQLRALGWLYRNAEKYRFDRNRIVVAGHSAGAHLAAMSLAALWPQFAADLPANLVKAAILLAGIYDLDPLLQADFISADLQLQPGDALALSPAYMPQSHPTPFITAAGGVDSDEFKRQNTLLARTWQASHVGDIKLPQTNHYTVCDEFATPGRPLFDICARLITGIR